MFPNIFGTGKLLERPPELIWKRKLIFQKSSATDGPTLVIEDDWRLLCQEWGGTESKCISARIKIDNKIGSYKEMLISEENATMSDEADISLSCTPIVETCPQACEECIGERESSELLKKLNYTNEDICICLITGKEPPKSILEASGSIADSSRRTSKWSRKATYGNSVNLNVSGSTSVYQLKMMIWESFGVCYLPNFVNLTFIFSCLMFTYMCLMSSLFSHVILWYHLRHYFVGYLVYCPLKEVMWTSVLGSIHETSVITEGLTGKYKLTVN